MNICTCASACGAVVTPLAAMASIEVRAMMDPLQEQNKANVAVLHQQLMEAQQQRPVHFKGEEHRYSKWKTKLLEFRERDRSEGWWVKSA